ncbi:MULTISPECIES: TraR/DksA family transcriptional regulator [Pseudomonadaceae]|uniref:TraR/DksA family transcriptional regulator n=1 Tax=Stutzerimonas stutzeri TaxID=316 RepID=A0AA42THG9_STUST|nr:MULTISPECIES: TraR/DksA family transcriptional regulator [Pseudomonadaceae]ELF1012284.1 TraR/DksA family transcriptional regulator [Pseudomonas aeruginosa]MBI6902704.1 TraR/DksA family transcriptional regulator [Pseudomonas aeruginosa]MDH1238916.1 TraR/DksA family transcriptional regulator [Stutzerimonas stutzeri]MDV2819000.1 TraR/DksA family transcriptional regulator [Pseudomonas aeruginosa]HBO0380579.1 TraR/DksA family transcriptional regulator [Pseudomonas aeruginosa]
MAMDDALNLAHFKSLLEQRAAELDRLLGDEASRSQSVELDQSKVGRLSRMDALQQQAMNDAIRARAQHERARLQMALKRLHEGEYGWCNQCGELIAPGRLEFDPATPLCITCASRTESS